MINYLEVEYWNKIETHFIHTSRNKCLCASVKPNLFYTVKSSYKILNKDLKPFALGNSVFKRKQLRSLHIM